MQLNRLFLKGETWKWIYEEIWKFGIHCFFNILLKDFVFGFILLFHRVFNVPGGGKNTVFYRCRFFNSLGYFFVLEVEGLNWSSNIVIWAYSLLHVFSVIFVNNFHLVRLLAETSWWEMESEDSFWFLQHDRDVGLEIFDGEGLRIFFGLLMFLFFRLAFRVCLWFTTRHEIRSLLEIGTTSLHFGVVLRVRVKVHENWGNF